MGALLGSASAAAGPVVLSEAGVSFFLGERAEVHRVARQLFGRTLEPWEYAGLAGAPDDVSVELGTLHDAIYLETRDPAARVYRAIQHVEPVDGGLRLVLDAVHIHRPRLRGQGLGLGMFRRQLAFARWLGIETIAARAGRQADENGYYTWPRFGFNGLLPTEIRCILPDELRYASCVLDLMACENGRCWWREHGVPLDVVFDVAPGSRSRRTLARYVGEKPGLGTRGSGPVTRG